MPLPAGTKPTPAACSPEADRVVQACEKHWAAQSNNCSGFVKDVAAALGVTLSGQANDICKYVAENWWSIDSGAAAADWAEAGYLVVGGLAATPNGHVVIVVPGPLAHGKYPTAYWGRLGGTGSKKKTVNYSWNATDRDKVKYYGSPLFSKS